MKVPNYWMNETGGALAAAVKTYIRGDPLLSEEVDLVRAYLRQWIAADTWRGPRVAFLRAAVEGITTREAIEAWLDIADREGIDPL